MAWDPLWRELHAALPVLFWLLLGGFVWVIGDLFQQYAVKYAGITRGIPLSNTNQLWGLLWGVLVFSELRGSSSTLFTQVLGGSVVMAIGAAVIALSTVSRREHERWRETAAREAERYGVDAGFTRASAMGESAHATAFGRGLDRLDDRRRGDGRAGGIRQRGASAADPRALGVGVGAGGGDAGRGRRVWRGAVENDAIQLSAAARTPFNAPARSRAACCRSRRCAASSASTSRAS